MSLLDGVILGILQGITEFLPVSSTGHLILARSMLGFETANTLAFDAVLHLATAMAVVVYFRKDLALYLHTIFRKLGRMPVNERDFNIVKALLIGTIPAAVLGVLLESYMATMFRNPVLVAMVLLAGSGLFAFAEWRYLHHTGERRVDTKTGFKIGWFQALALLPGMSRSGATISGGMIMGLTRSEAAKFAFLLAIPIMLGAGGKKLIELARDGSGLGFEALVLGSVVAFITAILAMHFMLAFVRKYSLWPFIWYRVTLAILVLVLYTV